MSVDSYRDTTPRGPAGCASALFLGSAGCFLLPGLVAVGSLGIFVAATIAGGGPGASRLVISASLAIPCLGNAAVAYWASSELSITQREGGDRHLRTFRFAFGAAVCNVVTSLAFAAYTAYGIWASGGRANPIAGVYMAAPALMSSSAAALVFLARRQETGVQ